MNGCHDMAILSVNISDFYYHYQKCFIHNVAYLKHLIYQKVLSLKIVDIYKKCCLNFSSTQDIFFYLHWFTIYKMVDNEYNMDIYEFIKISIGTVMRNPEMLKFVADYLKTKQKCQHVVNKLSYLLRYVPDQYRTQQMCDKAISENGGTLNLFLTAKKLRKV